jgi:hypothetical protein
VVRTSSALARRVAVLRRKMNPVREPRDYVVALEEGEELSEELQAQLGPHDTVTIREYPRGFLGVDGASTRGQHMSCWLRGPRGRMIPHVIRQYNVDISKV